MHTYVWISCAWVKIFHSYEQSNKANQIITQESMKKIHMDDFFKVCKGCHNKPNFYRLVL